MHKENIQKIIEHGTIAQMHDMKEIFEDVIDYLKVEDYDKYLCAEYKLHCIAYDGHLGEKLAKHWVSKMKNKDGTCGEHWTWEQIVQVAKDKSLKYDLSDLYAVLNMVYSDFYSSKFDTGNYVDLAKDWLDDVDVNKYKLLKYYFFIVCAK